MKVSVQVHCCLVPSSAYICIVACVLCGFFIDRKVAVLAEILQTLKLQREVGAGVYFGSLKSGGAGCVQFFVRGKVLLYQPPIHLSTHLAHVNLMDGLSIQLQRIPRQRHVPGVGVGKLVLDEECGGLMCVGSPQGGVCFSWLGIECFFESACFSCSWHRVSVEPRLPCAFAVMLVFFPPNDDHDEGRVVLID